MADVKEQLRQRRNDLSFLYSDIAHGGPDREAEIQSLRAEIARLEEEREKPNA